MSAEQEPLTQLIIFTEKVNVHKRTHSKEWAHCDVWEVGVGSIPSTLRHAFLPEFVQFILQFTIRTEVKYIFPTGSIIQCWIIYMRQ